MYLYVNQLQHGCYYIGTTDDPDNRYTQHDTGKGCHWTRIHPPIKQILLKEISGLAGLEEDKVTKEFMIRYGIDKVRGGSYSQVKLTDNMIENLRHEMWHAKGRCLRCGRKSHWAKNCFAKTDIYGNELTQNKSSSEDSSKSDESD